MSDNPGWRHLSDWRRPALTGVFREEVTGEIATLRLFRGQQRGEIYSWTKPVDASSGMFSDGGSIPPASTKMMFNEVPQWPKSLAGLYFLGLFSVAVYHHVH